MPVPSLSLIVHVHSHGLRFADRFLASMQAQTVAPTEILFCGDAGDCAALMKDAERICPATVLPDTAGLAAAYNAALTTARSDCAMFLDVADVLYGASSVEYALNRFQRANCDVLLADYAVFSRQGEPGDGLSHLAHCFDERNDLTLRDFPWLLGMDTPCGAVYSLAFLKSHGIRFEEKAPLRRRLFHFFCCRQGRFAMTARRILRHAEGAEMAEATAEACLAGLKELGCLRRAVDDAGDRRMTEAFHSLLLHECVRLSLRESACAAGAERLEILAHWHELLAHIPADQVARFPGVKDTSYLRAVRAGDHSAALALACGEDAAPVHALPLFGDTFPVEPRRRAHRLPEALRRAYAAIEPMRWPGARVIDDFSVLPEARVLVRWGTGATDVLDPRSRTIRHLEEYGPPKNPDRDRDRPFPAAPGAARGKRPLRVLTICSTLHGGAGEGTMRRIRALRSLGFDARAVALHSSRKEAYAGRVIPALDGRNGTSTAFFSASLLPRIYRSFLPSFRAHEAFPDAFAAVDFRQLAPLADWADIVHLHWIDGMLDYAHMPEVLGSKPVVWTMSSMNPFTGGCHYSEGCQRYRGQCRNCPQFSGEDATLPHSVWQLRERVYPHLNLTMVSPAPGIAAMARESSLLRGKEVCVIPNAYPLDDLPLLDRAEARRYLNLPQDRPILVYGAVASRLPRKGFKLLQEALAALRVARPKLADRLLVLGFGTTEFDCGCEVRNMHYVPARRMALVYAAANATAVPSMEDMGPMTIGESLLCGTPVVGFSALSLLTLLGRHLQGVYVAESFDAADFARGLAWALTLPGDAQRRRAIRETASKECSPELAARRHAQLYCRLLGRSGDFARPEQLSGLDPTPCDAQRTQAWIEQLSPPGQGEYDLIPRHWVWRHEGRERNARLFSRDADFNAFTYARRSHMRRLISGYLRNADKSEVDMDTCDLKAYQDGLCAAFIEQMFPEGGARILEIGGGNSRILAHYGTDGQFECWNIDKFEGVGNGPAFVPGKVRYHKLVTAYMGDLSTELPEHYFDLVFSTSVLEHVPDDPAVHKNIYDDIMRVLKPGGYSMHLLDFGLKNPIEWPGMVPFLFSTAPTLNTFIPFEAFPWANDIFCMSRYRYDFYWKSVLNMSYDNFGQPTSINIFWKK